MLIVAQLCQQSWKVIFLAGFALYAVERKYLSFEMDILICAAISLVSLAGLSTFGRRNERLRIWKQDPDTRVESVAEAYGIAFRLMAISSFTALSLYTEQIAVNALGSHFEAALYFTHTTYFLFTSSILNGYLAFMGAPWARENHDAYVAIMKKKGWRSLLLAIFYVGSVQAVAIVAWQVLDPAVGHVNLTLLLIFSITAVIRTVYTYPSAYFSAFGNNRHYNWIVTWQALSLVVGILFFFLLRWGAGISLIYAIAVASLSNWLLRTVMGLRYVAIISAATTRI